MTIKLITLDLDNTLWPVHDVIRRAEKASFAWLCATHPEISQQFDIHALITLRKTLVEENPNYLHNLTALRKAALLHIFRHAGMSDIEANQQADTAFQVFHDERNKVEMFPDVIPVLEQLARDYQLGALTNGNADLKKIGIAPLFTFHHSSESIGRRKPEPDMFMAALASSGVEAHETVHLGDHPEEDVHAALQHGFHAIWANFLGESWPNHLPEPTLSISHWRELPNTIERLNG